MKAEGIRTFVKLCAGFFTWHCFTESPRKSHEVETPWCLALQVEKRRHRSPFQSLIAAKWQQSNYPRLQLIISVANVFIIHNIGVLVVNGRLSYRRIMVSWNHISLVFHLGELN